MKNELCQLCPMKFGLLFKKYLCIAMCSTTTSTTIPTIIVTAATTIPTTIVTAATTISTAATT